MPLRGSPHHSPLLQFGIISASQTFAQQYRKELKQRAELISRHTTKQTDITEPYCCSPLIFPILARLV